MKVRRKDLKTLKPGHRLAPEDRRLAVNSMYFVEEVQHTEYQRRVLVSRRLRDAPPAYPFWLSNVGLLLVLAGFRLGVKRKV